jgi:valyl-tRNA synthetase
VQEGELQPQAEADMGLIMDVIGAIRNLRSELNVPPSKQVEAVLHSQNPEALKTVEQNRIYVASLARAEKMIFQSGGQKPKASATAVTGTVEIYVPLRGLINLDDEEKRIQKEIAKIAEELSRINLKLQNEEFLRKARVEAVDKEKEKAKTLAEKQAKFKEGLERVQAWKKSA